jgi:hypothetical protein
MMVRAEGHEVLERVVEVIAVDVVDIATFLAPFTHLARIHPVTRVIALRPPTETMRAAASLLAITPAALLLTTRRAIDTRATSTPRLIDEGATTRDAGSFDVRHTRILP